MDNAKLKNINPAKIDRSQLVQRSDVKVDSRLPKEEKVKSVLNQMNPYCYLDGNTVVITRFKDTDVSIDDCYCAYLSGV